MAIHSHVGNHRQPLVSPPAEPRRCVGEVSYLTELTRQKWNVSEGSECRRNASPWLPEASYCAAHMPPHLVMVVADRVRLYNELSAYVWEQVLAEIPLPT